MKNITVKLYENDRHELLNEDDAEVAMEDIWQWICKEIPGSPENRGFLILNRRDGAVWQIW